MKLLPIGGATEEESTTPSKYMIYLYHVKYVIYFTYDT